MQYSNYDMKNNVHATLSTAISSVATTIQLTSGQGSRFGTTFPQIATLESIENGKVMKREIVKITGRSGDNLTVVRAFAPCPENDDANSQTQSAISFNADDTISLYIPKEIFDIIKKSLNDIYDNGTNNMRTDVVSGLQVEVNPGSVLVGSAYYDFAGGTITLTDNATNYLEIDEDGNLANNTIGRNDGNTKLAIITTSGGSVTNIKDRRLGTVGGKIGGVNIHDLTEKASLSPDDEFIIADSENIRQNKKIKAGGMFSSLQSYDFVCGENIEEGDIIYLEKGVLKSEATTIQTFGDSSTPKIALKQYGSGIAGQNVNIKLGIVYGETPTNDLNLRIESDDNGTPSGNLLPGTTEQTIPLSLFKDGRGDIAVDVGSQTNFYTGFQAGEPLFNGDGTQLIIFNEKGPQTARLYNLSTPFDFTTATYIEDKILPTTNNSSYTHHLQYIDNGNKLLFRRSGNNTIIIYDLTTQYDASTFTNPQTSSNLGSIQSITMTDDGKHVLRFVYASTSSMTYYVYELTTPFDLSTINQIGSYTFTSVTYYGHSIAVNNEGTVIIYTNDRSGNYGTHRMETAIPRDFTTTTHLTIMSVFRGRLSVNNEGKNLTMSQPYDMHSYSIESNQKKGIEFQLSDELEIPLGTPFHFVISPIVEATQQFELYYGTMNGTLKPYSTNNGMNWITFSNSEAFFLSDFSISSYYMKQTANDLKKMGEIKVAKSDIEQRGLPFFDFEGISHHFEGLVQGLAYYLSNTPGKVSTTPGTNIKFIGIAKSEKEIEIATKNDILIMVLSNVVQTSSTTETVLKQFDIKRAGTYKLTITYGSTNTTNNTNASTIKVLKSNTEIRSDNIIAYGGCCAVVVFNANIGETVAIAGRGYSAAYGIKITQVVLEKIDVVDGYVENVID